MNHARVTMSVSSTIHSKPYRNWVRGALGLLYLHDGLYPFTDRVVKAEHARILRNLSPCTSCFVRNIQPAHARGNICIHRNKAKCNCKQKTNKVCKTCSELYDAIICGHRSRDPVWVTDTSTWCTDHWQIAKCFMTTTAPGTNNTATETDAAGLLSIIINGLFFQSELQCNIDPPNDRFCKVREIRNNILHNSTLELSDAEVIKYLNAMIAIREDQKTLIIDPSAKEAAQKLTEVVKEEIVITTTDEARAIQTALDAIKEAREQSEESIRELTKEEQSLLKKTLEKSEESIRKLTDEKQESLQNQISEAAQDIKTATEQALAEVGSTVSEYEPEVKRLKLKTDGHEERLKALEKEQIELKEQEQNLEKQISLLKSTEGKHQTRIDYLKQKQGLQQHLVGLYQNHYAKTWTSPLMTKDNDVNIGDVYVSPNMVVEEKDDTEINKSDDSAGDEHMSTANVSKKNAGSRIRHIYRYKDIFRTNNIKNRRIYIVGDVGTGKSSFCKMMMQNWCSAITGKWENGESESMRKQKVDNGDNTRDMSAFEFLFYIPLHTMSGHNDGISEMIKSQLNSHRALLDQIFSNESEACLILADGLDEWTPGKKSGSRLQHVTYGVPTSDLVHNATLITMSGPSAQGLLNMKSSECDMKVNLLGVNDLESIIEKYMALLLTSPLPAYDFQRRLSALGLKDLKKAPMLLQQIIWMYCKGYEIGKSVTYIYTNIVNIIFAWVHEKGRIEPSLKDFRDSLIGQLPLPKSFEKYSRCQENRDLIILLGKIAYDIFVTEDVSSVMLNRYRLKKFGLTDEDISAILHLGILKEEICDDPTDAKSQISFVHTSYMEYFASVYLSSCCLSKTRTDPTGPIQRTQIEDLIMCKTAAAEILRLKNILIMVCGLAPLLTEHICECIYQVAARDEQLMEYRRTLYINNEIVKLIQGMCFQCVSESHSSGQQLSLRVKLCDLSFGIFFKGNYDRTMCLSCVDFTGLVTCNIAAFILSHQQCTLLSTLLSQAVSLQTLKLDNVKCTESECDGHNIDLSHHERLKRLELYSCDCISIFGVSPAKSLEVCEIYYCEISHEQCTSLSLFLSQIVSLRNLVLFAVNCTKAECDGHGIDLTSHEQLKSVMFYTCDYFPVFDVRSVRTLESCQIESCNLSHEQCTLLYSTMSQAVSLEKLVLRDIKCTQAECEGHSIDLSQLDHLHILELYMFEQISVFGVNPVRTLKSCKIKNCKLSHEQCTSLSSFLSRTVSLAKLVLRDIECTQAECDGHSIDLSHHEHLQVLKLYSCNQRSVFRVDPVKTLQSCRIKYCKLSGKQNTLLSTFLSRAASLQRLTLFAVEFTKSECDSQSTNPSHYEQLKSQDLCSSGQLSVFGVNHVGTLNSCEIRNCYFTHEQCTALSLFLSHVVTLHKLKLDRIECTDADCDGHGIDLSNHQQLKSVVLRDCDQLSIFGVSPEVMQNRELQIVKGALSESDGHSK